VPSILDDAGESGGAGGGDVQVGSREEIGAQGTGGGETTVRRNRYGETA